MSVTSIDFYGTFGVYPTYTRVTLLAIALAPFSIGITVACVRELIAALAFLKVDQEVWARRIRVVVSLHTSVPLILSIISFYVESRILLLLTKLFSAWAVLFVAISIDIVYLMLRWHRRGMMTSGVVSTNSKGPSNWTSVLKYWRVYAIGLSICMVAVVGGIVDELTSDGATELVRYNINFEADEDQVPATNAITVPVLVIIVYMIMTWRAWIGLKKDVESSIKKSSSSGGHGTKTASTGGGGGTFQANSQVRSTSDTTVSIIEMNAAATNKLEERDLIYHTNRGAPNGFVPTGFKGAEYA